MLINLTAPCSMSGVLRILNISVRSLQRYRVDGGGPTFTKVGVKRICYQLRDLTSYIDARRFASTSAAERGNVAT
jgi:hypothetical protein